MTQFEKTLSLSQEEFPDDSAFPRVLPTKQLQCLENSFEVMQNTYDEFHLKTLLNQTLTVSEFIQLHQRLRVLINDELIPFCQGANGIDILHEYYPENAQLAALCHKVDAFYVALKNVHDNQFIQLHKISQKRLEKCRNFLESAELLTDMKKKITAQGLWNTCPQGVIIKQECKSLVQELYSIKINNLNMAHLKSLLLANCIMRLLKYQLTIIQVQRDATDSFTQQPMYKISLDKVATEEQANLNCLNNRIEPLHLYLKKVIKKYPHHSQLITMEEAILVNKKQAEKARDIDFPNLKHQVSFFRHLGFSEENKPREPLVLSMDEERNLSKNRKLRKLRFEPIDSNLTFGPDLCQGLKRFYRS